jgi:multidrug efflux pump
VNIAEICIKRPVFATVLSLMILLVGIVSMERLPLREYPRVDQPVLNIWTRYTGATAEVIESEVTAPIEEMMSGLEGIDFMRSTSRAGESVVTIAFKQDREIEAAAADVRDRLGQVSYSLPEDISAPVIWKQDADMSPLLWITVAGHSMSLMELTEFANEQIKDRLLIIKGVGQIITWAGRDFAMRIWVDRIALASFGLTVQDVEQAIRRQNVDIPSGRIESSRTELNILAKTSLQSPEQFGQIIIAEKDGYLIRLKDLARVELGSSEVRTSARVNGENTLAFGVRLQSVANPLEVAEAVNAELEQIRQGLPEGIEVETVVDGSDHIRESIDNVYTTLIEALILVVLVIFVFLRSPRATLIPAVTIPISLIGVNALMWWWGFSVNTLTLLALVLGIGIVVDDAIVVLENIHRHIEAGMERKAAAIRGSKEIFFAVIAMTLTLAAVFAPLGFSEGPTGKLFIEFALTLAGAVIISGFTALTLTPMMCAYLLENGHPQPPGNGISRKIHQLSAGVESSIVGLTSAYVALARKLTRKPLPALGVVAGVIVAAVAITAALPRELAPYEDTGLVMAFAIAPEGTNIEYGERYSTQLVANILAIPEVDKVLASYGSPTVNQHRFTIKLSDWHLRQRSQFEVHEDIKALVAAAPGMIFITMNRPPLGQQSRQRPVNLLLQSSLPYAELASISEQVMDKLRGNTALSGLNLDLTLNKPQLELALDREKIADMGLKVDTVGRTLETLFGGRNVTEFQRGAKKYDVIVQMAAEERSDPTDIREVYLRTDRDQLVLLEDVVYLQETIVPRQLDHFNKLRAANITASPAPGYSLGEALQSAVADIESMQLAGISLEFSGESREFLQSSQQIYFTALLSLVFIFLVLAAQFESFRDPLIILLAVPFAILGASLLLTATGKSFSIFTQIGMITLVGLITKHGIMLVDATNRMRLEGEDKFEAMMQACGQRFRPILMTSAAMVLGSVPLAIAAGAGAESRSQIGWVIVGGLTVGTILTLLVTPALYMLISPDRLREIEPTESIPS